MEKMTRASLMYHDYVYTLGTLLDMAKANVTEWQKQIEWESWHDNNLICIMQHYASKAQAQAVVDTIQHILDEYIKEEYTSEFQNQYEKV
jgi:hypothetical protein